MSWPAAGIYVFKFFKTLFLLFPGPRTPFLGFYTLYTIFGRMPGIEPELLQSQPGVLPMSYTHQILIVIVSVQCDMICDITEFFLYFKNACIVCVMVI